MNANLLSQPEAGLNPIQILFGLSVDLVAIIWLMILFMALGNNNMSDIFHIQPLL